MDRLLLSHITNGDRSPINPGVDVQLIYLVYSIRRLPSFLSRRRVGCVIAVLVSSQTGLEQSYTPTLVATAVKSSVKIGRPARLNCVKTPGPLRVLPDASRTSVPTDSNVPLHTPP